MNMTRRTLFKLASTAAFAFSMGTAWGAQPVVEIIAFAHPPVQSALKPLRDWLASQGKKVRVVETDMESAAGEKRMASVGLTGHIPIVVLVDGKYAFTRKDGTPVELKSFPFGLGTPEGVKGAWALDDVKAAISAQGAR
jgi:hypothetical protein